ncbi:hypothetical protein Ruko_09610 [Ruthenibacterium sp. TH_2024_36131]|uniref:hypothetical protein n=1 Tax=Owariibacterium komagatae TaxID=3136601 RepID=UPI0038B38BA5
MKQENQHSRKKRADILLVGIGGGGGNALSSLIVTDRLSDRVDTLAMNTDLSALMIRQDRSGVKILQLGKNLCRGRGAYDLEVGEAAMREAKEQVCAAVRGYSMVVLIACLGGGTGTGGTTVLAGWLREMGIPHKVVAQIPYYFEGSRKAGLAREALEQLRQAGECVREVAEAEIQETARAMGIEKFTLMNCFELADQVVVQQVEKILVEMGAISRTKNE